MPRRTTRRSLTSEDADLIARLGSLATALVADACVRLGLPVRAAPAAIRHQAGPDLVAGFVRPVEHAGSVDVFLEAIDESRPGEVLVIGNGGRMDEGCVGDLIALETQAAGLAGIVVWGSTRDTAELDEIGLPVFSCGTFPFGPLGPRPRLEDALRVAHVGSLDVSADDAVLADRDGVVFVELSHLAAAVDSALEIRRRERGQADLARSGVSLRRQLDFDGYVARRSADPDYSFRVHLAQRGGAIEE